MKTKKLELVHTLVLTKPITHFIWISLVFPLPFTCSRIQSSIALSNNMKWLLSDRFEHGLVRSPEATKMTKMHSSLCDTCEVKILLDEVLSGQRAVQGALRAKGRPSPYHEPLGISRQKKARDWPWKTEGGRTCGGKLGTAVDRHLKCLEIVYKKFIF